MNIPTERSGPDPAIRFLKERLRGTEFGLFRSMMR